MTEQEIEKLRSEIGRRDAYIHELHLTGDALRREIRDAHADLEDFVHWLRDAESEKEKGKTRAAPRGLRSLFGKQKPAGPPPPVSTEVPGAPFRYYLKSSPYRVYRDPSFALEGWAFPESGQAVTGLRARVDEEVFFGTYGLEEPPVAGWHGVQANNPRPGFKVVVDTPPGRHRLSLEAQLGRSDWFSILTTPIWVVVKNPGP